MQFWSRKRGPVVALGAALLLVLQTLAGAAAFGAGPDRVDLFGNPVCVTKADGSGPLHDGHGKMSPGCCAAGCSMFTAMLAAPDGQHWQQWPPSAEMLRRRDDPGISRERQHQPGNPRAPPVTA